jgi:alpha-mannosidase
MSAQRLPLYYTFGNHMHWVDMEWLWGYHVLPDSVRDMLFFCAETGAKGNINFDGIGYEKLAVEAPEALQALKEAVQGGSIEVVGASYGQPYGLFHGGESNVRQRVYGVRTTHRLLGVRPRTFWEEEFDFFPQLPQMLKGVGFQYASLFFQWTWHTPHLPKETLPAIWWVGMDGSRLLTAPRGPLNLHQWPEDFAELLASPLPREMPVPGIIQWLELMPSPDWMCRAELMLPQLQALKAHPAYELRFVTLSDYLELARGHAEERYYTLDDVFHGMSLGKNGDLFRRFSRKSEQQALTAETLSVLAGLCGRPYPSWDVYPTWELEEAWRELLAAQHHDNDECEGLCGHVGRRSYERSLGLSAHVVERTVKRLAERTKGAAGRLVVFNPLAWERNAVVTHPATGERFLVKDVPACGYRVLSDAEAKPSAVMLEETHEEVRLRRGPLQVNINKARGVITEILSDAFPSGLLDFPLADLRMTRGGEVEGLGDAAVSVGGTANDPLVMIERRSATAAVVKVTVRLAVELDAIDLHYHATDLPRPDPGMHAALRTTVATKLENPTFLHDHPYGISKIKAEGTYLRKYPTGDWMTSPQVFEEVHNPFTSLGLLDITSAEGGLLYLHDGSQAMLREGNKVHNLLSLYDPWDEDYFVSDLNVNVRLMPHGPLSHAERWRLSQEFERSAHVLQAVTDGGDLPSTFSAVACDVIGVVVTAFYRETEEAGRKLDTYAGAGMGYPHVLRLVEFDGRATHARVRVPGEVAGAYRSNLLGEIIAPVAIRPITSGWSELEVELAPYELVTLYLDLVMGRKVTRDLDAHRSVWATVHRVEEQA